MISIGTSDDALHFVAPLAKGAKSTVSLLPITLQIPLLIRAVSVMFQKLPTMHFGIVPILCLFYARFYATPQLNISNLMQISLVYKSLVTSTYSINS